MGNGEWAFIINNSPFIIHHSYLSHVIMKSLANFRHAIVLALIPVTPILCQAQSDFRAHVTQNMMTVINPMQPRQGLRTEFDFRRAGPARINCDIHNWMQAWIYVLRHPYYALTTSDGSFRMTDVPPGEYELVAWQEHLGERTTTVRVEAGKNTKLTFDLTEE